MEQAETENTANLANRVGHAAKWNVGASIVIKVISFLTTMFLARLMGPVEFGLFALAFVFIDGFGIFKSMGFESALVQRKDNIDIAADTAFVIIPLMGIFMYLVLYISIPFITAGFDSPELPGVLRILGLIFIVNTFTRVPYSILEKRLQFDKRSWAEMASQVIYSIVAITLAINGHGVWSLVWGFLSMTVSKSCFIWYLVDWRPKFKFDKDIAIDMFHFGKFMFLSSLLTFLASNFDRIVVGKVLGVGILGVYAIAYNFADLINAFIGYKVSEILFPVYSKLQDDIENLRLAYLKVFRVLLLAVLPFSMGLLFLGAEFLELAFGEKWMKAIPVLKILSCMSIFNILIMSTKSVLSGIKKPHVGLITACIRVGLYCTLIIPAGKLYGVNGVAAAVLISACVAMLFAIYYLKKTIHFTWKDLLMNMWPAIQASAIMVAVLLGLKVLFNQFSLPLIVTFGSSVVIAILVYALAVYKIDRPIINQIRSMVGV